MVADVPATNSKTVTLSRIGKSQVLRIPKEFEFNASRVRITRLKNGNLAIAPVLEETFAELLAEWAKEDVDPKELDWPEIEDLPPKSHDHLFE